MPSRAPVAALSAYALLLSACSCQDDPLHQAQGTLHIRVINIGPEIATIESHVTLAGETAADLPKLTPVVRPETSISELLAPEDYKVRVVARDAAGAPSRSVTISDVFIFDEKTTEIEVDLSSAPPIMIPPVDCSAASVLPVCTLCRDGFEAAAEDDPRCGTISCRGLDRFELRGDNGPVGTSSCVAHTHPDLVDHRCLGRLTCAVPNGPSCQGQEMKIAEKGPCHRIQGCEAGQPVVSAVEDGTPCGGTRICRGGVCGESVDAGFPPADAGFPPADAGFPVDAGFPTPLNGCADGTREGFQSLVDYPEIAGCSGGWSVPGVTINGQLPSCGRGAGNSSANSSGTGCSAVDLCASGWHVCRGRSEVAQRAPSGCGAAVPPGTPDKMLFFAVAQQSQMNTVCGASGSDNDVSGCGNLGVALTPETICVPLDRALASTRAGSCGYNEAEPSLGPWQCAGGAGADLHEGALVTKHGCPNRSCSYSGQPIGDADKGGVLCCRD